MFSLHRRTVLPRWGNYTLEALVRNVKTNGKQPSQIYQADNWKIHCSRMLRMYMYFARRICRLKKKQSHNDCSSGNRDMPNMDSLLLTFQVRSLRLMIKIQPLDTSIKKNVWKNVTLLKNSDFLFLHMNTNILEKYFPNSFIFLRDA